MDFWSRLVRPDEANAKLKAAVELVLLFHSVSPWEEEKRDKWFSLLSCIYPPRQSIPLASQQPTTKALCDACRLALKSAE